MPTAPKLPSYEELSTPEVPVTTAVLKAGSHHYGRQCDKANKEFMLCRYEEDDPRKCLKEGRVVSQCVVDFLQTIKTHCSEPFAEYWTCLDRKELEFRRCRKQQEKFDNCVFEKLGWVRPELGELTQTTVVKTERPYPAKKTRPKPPPTPNEKPPKDLPPAKYGSRFYFWN